MLETSTSTTLETSTSIVDVDHPALLEDSTGPNLTRFTMTVISYRKLVTSFKIALS